MVGSRVATANGRHLEVRTAGRGPGLVVVHGSAVAARHYAGLADALGGHFTVHLYDRRGRGTPVEDTHGVAADADDLRAVLTHTGARRVLAHSYGGLVALWAAATEPGLPVDRLALFDPAVSIDGSFPSAWCEPFAVAAAADDFPLAMAVLSKGLGSAGWVSMLPVPVQRVLAHVFARTAQGREWRTMIPSAVAEARQVLALDGPASAYAGLTARVLVTTGALSPPYFRPAAAALAGAVPGARHVVLPRVGHDSIMTASAALLGPVVGFLG